MKKLSLYHGSSEIVKAPEYGKGKKNNDYGPGFYCTEHRELAAEWACMTENDGYINCYELDVSGLNILNLQDEKFSILNWLALLFHNRKLRLSSPIERKGTNFIIQKYLPDTEKCDVIIGYRADDSYFSFARAFLTNTITIDQLGIAMRLGKLGEQYMLKSEKAFQKIRFSHYEIAPFEVYYAKRKARDEAARKAYHEICEEDADGIYLRDIIKNGGLS